MRARDVAIGLLFCALGAAMLPVGLVALGRGEDLGVRVAVTNGRAVLANSATPPTLSEVFPLELRHRLIGRGAADFEGPGLALRTWSVEYGHRWTREVFMPVLRGPFDAVGTPWPCGIGLRLRASLFDRGPGRGNDLATAIAARLRDLFPRDVGVSPFSLHFPAARTIDVRITPRDGALDARYDIRLEDDTRFQGGVRVTFTEHDGDLEAHPTVTSFDWTGGTRTDWRLRVVDLFSGIVDRTARGIAERRITERVAEIMDRVMDRVRAPRTLGADRPGDRAELRFCSAPRIDATGMHLTLGAVVSLAPPHFDATITGPAHMDATPRFDMLPPPTSDVEIVATPGLVQQALFVLWQTSRIERWSNAPATLLALQDQARDRLTFDIDGLHVHLPPALVPAATSGGAAWSVRFADVRLGHTSSGLQVRAHVDSNVRIVARRGTLGVDGGFSALRIDCVERSRVGASSVLRPCFSDVVSAIRADPLLSERRTWSLDPSTLDRFLHVRMDGDVTLELRNVRATMGGSPVVARVAADAVLGHGAP